MQLICSGIIKCHGLDLCSLGCVNYFRCKSNRCVSRERVCDGKHGKHCPKHGEHCPEDDGWNVGPGFKCIRNGKICKLPQQLLFDEEQDCDKGEDLCFFKENSNSTEK